MTRTRTMVVSLHDVAPATAESSRRWLELLESAGVRATLLVVPGPWRGKSLATAPAFAEWLRAAVSRGHEVAQHGFSHERKPGMESTPRRELVGRVMARGAEEFWHLPVSRASELMAVGREIIEQTGLTVDGFVAPGWLMSEGAREAARDLGYRYICTHTAVIDLADERSIFAPTTSQRPRSLLSRPTAAFNSGLVAFAAGRFDVMRVAIHPADLASQRLARANMALCGTLLAEGHIPVTYRELVGAHIARDESLS